MATSTIFNFNFNNSEIVDSTGQWYDATTGTPTTEFIEHDGNTALLQRAYTHIDGTPYLRDINPVFLQSRDPTFTAHTYTIELQIYPLWDSGGWGPWDGDVLDFNPTESDEEGWVKLKTIQQRASESNTFYWREYDLGPDGTGIPFLTVTAADGTYNRWYSIRIERVDDGTNTGATVKIYVDGTLVVNETLTHPQDARRGRIGDSIRYTFRRSSTDPQGAGVAIDNFKLTAGIAPSSVVDVSLANLQRNNANLLSFIKGKVPTVNDGTLTIQKNGTNVATFTANQSTAATANITVPVNTSDLVNDSGYLTASSNLDASKLTSGTVDIARLPQGALERLIKVANEAARYALTTADVQLGDTVQQLDTGIMYVVTDTDHLDSAAGYTEYTAGTAASVPWSGVTGKPTFAAVATSGAYSDLTGTPIIPTVNNATLTIQQNGTTVDTFTANASVDKTININTADDTKIPLAGSNAISGSLIPATDGTVNLGGSSYQWNNAYIKSLTINGVACGDILTHNASEFVPRSGGAVLDGDEYAQTVTNSRVAFRGGTSSTTGGTLYAHGKDYTVKAGYAGLIARDSNSSSYAELDPKGNLILTADSFEIVKNDSNDVLRLSGGTSYGVGGGGLALHGKNRPNSPSAVVIFSHIDGGTDRLMWFMPDGTWTWNGTACQITSDARLKQQISEIDDKLLDAWEDVNLVQFKYNDAVDDKGDNARLHTGYVVQQIDKACKDHNVDISAYGLYCHEEYPEETEEVEVLQKDGTKTKEKKVIREASEHYSLRYTEALIVECKYLRRCIARLTARIEELEKEQEASK